MEFPDIPAAEAEALYESYCEKARSSIGKFWKWTQISFFGLLITPGLQALLYDVKSDLQGTPFWLLQYFVFLLICIVLIATLRAIYWSLLEQKFHEVLDGLEKLCPDIEENIRTKLGEKYYICSFWRPTPFFGVKLIASTACLIGVWGWSIWYFSSVFSVSFTLLLCVTPYVVVLISAFLWLVHKFHRKRIISAIIQRFRQLTPKIKI